MNHPDLSSRPYRMVVERVMGASPSALYLAWTTDQFERWFAAPGTLSMRAEVGAPFFFETQHGGQPHTTADFSGSSLATSSN